MRTMSQVSRRAPVSVGAQAQAAGTTAAAIADCGDGVTAVCIHRSRRRTAGASHGSAPCGWTKIVLWTGNGRPARNGFEPTHFFFDCTSLGTCEPSGVTSPSHAPVRRTAASESRGGCQIPPQPTPVRRERKQIGARASPRHSVFCFLKWFLDNDLHA